MARRVKQRERVLDMLRESTGPLDAHHLAAALDLHVTTIRFHLSGLVDEGLVRIRPLPAEKVGRPRMGYLAVREPSYTDLVALLAARIGGSATERERKAFEVGDDWAGMLGLSPAPTTDAGALVIESLHQLGFETQTATNAFGTHSITLCTCRWPRSRAATPKCTRHPARPDPARPRRPCRRTRSLVHRRRVSRPSGRQLPRRARIAPRTEQSRNDSSPR